MTFLGRRKLAKLSVSHSAYSRSSQRKHQQLDRIYAYQLFPSEMPNTSSILAPATPPGVLGSAGTVISVRISQRMLVSREAIAIGRCE